MWNRGPYNQGSTVIHKIGKNALVISIIKAFKKRDPVKSKSVFKSSNIENCRDVF
jgi:hypothetical protein